MPHDRRERSLPARRVSRRDFLETTGAAAMGAAALRAGTASAESPGVLGAPPAGETRRGLLYPRQNQHRGVQDLSGLVARLNEAGVPAPNGQPWTAELFQKEMKRLGA